MATVAILGSHFAGDFFLGVDILVTSMLVNFGVMCITVLSLPHRNPEIASRMTVVRKRSMQIPLASLGACLLALFLGVHLWKDLTAVHSAWYFHSTPLWLAVMIGASLVYFREVAKLKADGIDVDAIFSDLPAE